MSYTAQHALAVRMLTAKGRPATITKDTVTSVDVTTDTPVVATTAMGVVVVILPARPTQADSFEQGTLVRAKYRTVYISTPLWTFVPSGGETIDWGDGAWKLTGCSPLSPDNTGPLLLTATVERV